MAFIVGSDMQKTNDSKELKRKRNQEKDINEGCGFTNVWKGQQEKFRN